MILAIADLIHRKPQGLFNYSSRFNAIAGIVSINMVAISSFVLLIEKLIRPNPLGRIGVFTFFIFGAYILGLRMILKNQKKLMMLSEKKEEEVKSTRLDKIKSLLVVQE